jgi:hypothetical protein
MYLKTIQKIFKIIWTGLKRIGLLFILEEVASASKDGKKDEKKETLPREAEEPNKKKK